MGKDPASVRNRIEIMEKMLEGLIAIPGTRQRMGLDAALGVIPIVGDIVSAAMGGWMIWEARNLGLSKFQLARMAANVGLDTTIGIIPFVGDAFDLFFRSNRRNLKIIRRHLDRHHPASAIIDR